MTDKIQTIASEAKADIAKVVAFWSDYRLLYLTMAACLIVGAIAGYKVHP